MSVAADQVVDCGSKIVIPGLVSAHSHLTGIFQRCVWDESSFEAWASRSSSAEYRLNPSPEEIYSLHCAACIEFIRNGVTTVLNMFTLRSGLHIGMVEAACRAFADTGVRGVLALMIRDQPSRSGRRADDPERWMSFIEAAADCVAQFDSRIDFMLAPAAPQWCSDRLLMYCRNFAESHSTGIHTHVAEAKTHAETARDLYGMPIIRHLEKIGFLTPRVSVAHAIWLDEEEIDLLRQYEVKIVHNPAANMKLGSGIAQIKKMLRKGLTVGLGADSVNAATVYSIFEQMKLSVLLPRVRWQADDWVFPLEAFEMGTVGGAKALLLDHLVGSIEEGKKADLVILKPSPAFLPMNELISQLVLCENGSSVDGVFVDGKPVLLNGRILTIEEHDIQLAVSTVSERFRQVRNELLRT
jgi:cytosine/adenosine deaminase-related metal-dependent hydrolase